MRDVLINKISHKHSHMYSHKKVSIFIWHLESHNIWWCCLCMHHYLAYSHSTYLKEVTTHESWQKYYENFPANLRHISNGTRSKKNLWFMKFPFSQFFFIMLRGLKERKGNRISQEEIISKWAFPHLYLHDFYSP